MKMLDLAKLPANPSATRGQKFLGVTDDELWDASKEYSRRMKEAKDPHEAFGLKKELIIEIAREASERNLAWIREHLDKSRPMELLNQLYKAPQDRAIFVLRLLRKHGLKQVSLVTWIAADRFLSARVERFGGDALRKIFVLMGRK